MRKWLLGTVILLAAVAGAFIASPYPGVWLIRVVFDRGAVEASTRLEKHVPPGVTTTTHRYDENDPDAVLDIHLAPDPDPTLPIVVWIHGGGFVSGRRADITNYLKVLAGRGFTVVNLDYTIAPEARYPEPVRQVNTALAYLTREGESLGLSTGRMVLAGDSAGAQIAAQVTAVIANPAYAERIGVAPGAAPRQIVGALLFCGVYDITGMGGKGGILDRFVHVTAWAYSGQRNWREDETFATMSVTPWLTSAVPPAFISAGNADPLAPQSVALGEALAAQGIPVTTLFFPPNYSPPLGHEYQFDLDGEAGRTALDRTVAWLKGL